jgi:hypothetical protein
MLLNFLVDDSQFNYITKLEQTNTNKIYFHVWLNLPCLMIASLATSQNRKKEKPPPPQQHCLEAFVFTPIFI